MKKVKQARINELQEVVEQLKNTVKTIQEMKKEQAKELSFFDGYNSGLDFAINVLKIDLMVFNTKIRLIENNEL